MFPLTCQCDGARWVAAAHRVVMDTLRVWLGFIRGLTLLSRHHSPSLSIVDEFKGVWDTFCVSKTMTCDLCFVPADEDVFFYHDQLRKTWRQNYLLRFVLFCCDFFLYVCLILIINIFVLSQSKLYWIPDLCTSTTLP